ncbi:MAG: hypothetical protein K9N49_02020 [Candidatus Marinimicrobia bacterium]|nr:hypothetical protein [Candidatus Neomarinimicrobiota bacterium]
MKITAKQSAIEFTRDGISRLGDPASKRTYFEAGADSAKWFHLIVPTPTWSSRAVTPAEAGTFELSEQADGKILRYADFTVAGQQVALQVDVFVTAPAGADEIRLKLSVVNRGCEAVTGACFPWLVGWQSPGDPARDRVLLGPGAAPVAPAALSADWRIAWANGFGEEREGNFPVQTHVPWLDISGEKGGVSFINYQSHPRQCYSAIKNLAGFQGAACTPALFWGFYAYIPAGQEWTSPEIGIATHNGDWHRTADRYRAWAETRIPPAPVNRRLRESIGSLHVWFEGFDGSQHNAVADLPRIAAEARNCGVHELCVWDRLTMGVYGTAYQPEEDVLAYPAEKKAALAKAIQAAVYAGSDVSALINFRLMNPLRQVFQVEHLAEDMQATLLGTGKIETWPVAHIPGKFYPTAHLGPGCQVFSPFSEKYRRRVARLIAEYLDFGYTSLFYDQPFEYLPDYSRKEAGGVPEMTYAATLDLIRNARDQLKHRHPDAAIMGEQCDVFGSEVIDQWMTWAWSDHPNGLQMLRQMHYALPTTVFNCVISVDSGAPQAACGLACQAFAMGLHLFLAVDALTGTLGDVPELGAYVRQLAELRKHCAARTVHGRFRDDQGFTIETGDGLVAYSYDSPAGPALIVAAPRQAGSAVIRLEREAFAHPGNPRAGRIVSLDLLESATSGDTGIFELKQNEARVWLP